jgi:hypothetical protein
MEKGLQILKKLDSALFVKLDQLQTKSEYNRFIEFYSNLDDNQQVIAKWSLLIFSFSLPLLIVFIFWIGNSSLHSDYEARLELIDTMQEIIAQNSEVGGITAMLASANAINSESELQTRMSQVLTRGGIDLNKIKVSNFSLENVSDGLTRSEADVKFENISTDQLVSLFTFLIQTEKFKISSVEISRNAQTNFLDGVFHAIHYGQVLTQEDEY